jgi:hypothetical protein
MLWRLLLEEYSPKLKYIKGENIIVADALSRLDLINNEPYEQMSIEQTVELYAINDKEFPTTYPLGYVEISYQQQKDKDLKRLAMQNPSHYCIHERRFSGQTYRLVTRENKNVIP